MIPKRIDQLDPDITTLQSTDVLPIVPTGTSVANKVTLGALAGYVISTVPNPIYTLKIVIPSTQVKTLNTLPILLISAIGINKTINIIADTVSLKKDPSVVVYDFASGVTAVTIVQSVSNLTLGSAFDIKTEIIDPVILNDLREVMKVRATSTISNPVLIAPYQDTYNVYLWNTLGDATQGDGDVTLSFDYRVVDLS
jgi:hypothetical protein